MSLRKFDIFPKLDDQYRVGTTIGGILSVFSIISTIILSWVEIHSFLHPPIRQRLFIDSIRPTELDGRTISANSQPRLEVAFNFTFPLIPCYVLHFDALDPITQLPLPVDSVTSTFTRLSPSGSPIGALPSDFLDSTPQESCGSCYIGGIQESQCCYSCQDVFAAYHRAGFRPPPLLEIAQCAEVRERISHYGGEGCRVSGAFRAVKVAGEFHISPGVSWFSEGWHVHDVETFGLTFDKINLTHTVERLQFAGGSGALPEGGLECVHVGQKPWRAIYTADVLGENFSVSRYGVEVSQAYGPGVYVKFDVSPIGAVEYVDKEQGLHLVGRLLTVIGGVLGLFRLIDALAYSSRKKAEKKAGQLVEEGK